jgi:hypothetical protein
MLTRSVDLHRAFRHSSARPPGRRPAHQTQAA